MCRKVSIMPQFIRSTKSINAFRDQVANFGWLDDEFMAMTMTCCRSPICCNLVILLPVFEAAAAGMNSNMAFSIADKVKKSFTPGFGPLQFGFTKVVPVAHDHIEFGEVGGGYLFGLFGYLNGKARSVLISALFQLWSLPSRGYSRRCRSTLRSFVPPQRRFECIEVSRPVNNIV